MKNILIDRLSDALASSQRMQSEPPWKLVTQTSAGGAFAVGFDPAKEQLLVISADGQGIFDAVTGDRVYRNRKESGYDHKKLEAKRLDKPDAHPIPMAGHDGGGLRRSTSDGWTVENLQINWPTSYSILQQPGASIFFLAPQWEQYGKDASFRVLARSEGLPVAFGFSWSGKSLVWLDRSDLLIWNRDS